MAARTNHGRVPLFDYPDVDLKSEVLRLEKSATPAFKST